MRKESNRWGVHWLIFQFRPGARFSKAPETFRAHKAMAKSGTLTVTITALFYSHILNMNSGSFAQEVSGVYTSPFLDIDKLKMALRTRNVSEAFEKRAPGLDCWC